MSIRKIGHASLIIAVGAASVNLLQVLKLVIVGAWFGASVGKLDEYSVTINLIAAIQGVLLGALQVAFIPVYVGYKAKGEHERAERALRAVASTSIASVVLASLVLGATASPLLRLAAIGFDETSHSMNVPLFRLGLIYMVLSVLCDMLTTFYNANKRYAVPALAPILSMAISIIYLLTFRQQGVYALIYGLIWGNLAQLALQLACAASKGGFRLSFTSRPFHADALPVYRMMVPMAISLSLSHLNILVDQGVASTLGTGSVSVLYYATRLHDVLVKLFICSVAAALLPYLSQYVADRRFAELRSTLALSIRAALLILAPITILVCFFGPATVAVVLRRQAFTTADAIAVANVWAAYSLGLFFIATVFFQQRCFMARRDLTPLWVAPTFGIPLNLLLDLWFSRMWGVTGIALATTTVYLVYMVTYQIWLRRWFRSEAIQSAQTTPAWRSLAAITILFGTCWALNWPAHRTLTWFDATTTPAIARATTLAIICATSAFSIGIYMLSLKVLHVAEMRLLARFLTRKH